MGKRDSPFRYDILGEREPDPEKKKEVHMVFEASRDAARALSILCTNTQAKLVTASFMTTNRNAITMCFGTASNTNV